MTLILILTSIILLVLGYIYRKQTETKKYQEPGYILKLQQIFAFFEMLHELNDYVTWVERDKIKSIYEDVYKQFKSKVKYYGKEEKIREFVSTYENMDSYIADFNTEFVRKQKEELKLYFDDIEGKPLDDQQLLQTQSAFWKPYIA
jgi:DNA helicase-4